MPTCAAEGCGARSDRGDVLKSFPRGDFKRRQIWIDRVSRPGWKPTKYSALCELHFDKDQWELPREDGKRKLKNNALPSVFSVEHPSNHHIVATDHSYCLPRLRKLYDDSDTEDAPESTIHEIEHVKVEVDEDFSPEYDEVDSECQLQNEPEDIQCTPDIVLYPGNEEPEPMEMVQCEEEIPNVNINDPSNDPLAISADDVVKSKGVVPNFPHAKKYVFVPNNTAVVQPWCLDAEGEPKVAATPAIKVRSPDILFKPTSAILEGKPDSGKSVPTVRKILPRPPFPKSGLIRNPSKLPVAPLKSPIKLLTKKHLLKIPNSAVTSQNVTIPQSVQVDLNKNQQDATRLGNSPTCQNNPSSYKEIKFILKNGKMRRLKFAIKTLQPFGNKKYTTIIQNINKSNIKSGISLEKKKLSKNLAYDGEKKHSTEKLKSIMSYAEIENIFLEHQYSKKISWQPLTIHGLKLKTAEKDQASQEKELDSNFNEKLTLPNQKLPFLLPKNHTLSDPVNSSVIFLEPYDKPSSPNMTEDADKLQTTMKKKKIQLYDCKICNISFLTLPTLKIHLAVHKRMLSGDGKIVAINETGLKTKRRKRNLSHSKSVNKGTEKINARRLKLSKMDVKQTPYKFENKIVSIPNLMALRKFTKNKRGSVNNRLDKKYSHCENFISKKGRLCKKPKKLIAESCNTSKDQSATYEHSFETPEKDICQQNIFEERKFDQSKLKKLDIEDVYHDIALLKQPIVLIPKLDISKITNLRINNLSNFIDGDKDKSVNKKAMKQIKTSDKTLHSFKGVKDTSNIKNCTTVKSEKKEESSYITRSKVKDVKIILTGLKQSSDNSNLKKEKSCDINLRNKKRWNVNINNNVKSLLNNNNKQKGRIKNNYEIKNNLNDRSSTAIDNKESNARIFTDLNYKCKLCSRRFSKSFQLRRHVTCDHKAVKHNGFRCGQKSCGRTFETKRELDKHFKTHRKTLHLNKKNT